MALSYVNALKYCSDFPLEKKIKPHFKEVLKNTKNFTYKNKQDFVNDMQPILKQSTKVLKNFNSWLKNPYFVPQDLAMNMDKVIPPNEKKIEHEIKKTKKQKKYIDQESSSSEYELNCETTPPSSSISVDVKSELGLNLIGGEIVYPAKPSSTKLSQKTPTQSTKSKKQKTRYQPQRTKKNQKKTVKKDEEEKNEYGSMEKEYGPLDMNSVINDPKTLHWLDIQHVPLTKNELYPSVTQDSSTEIEISMPNLNIVVETPSTSKSECSSMIPLTRHPEIKGYIGYEIRDEEYYLSEQRPLHELVIPPGAYWKRREKVWKSINVSLAEALICQLNLFIPSSL